MFVTGNLEDEARAKIDQIANADYFIKPFDMANTLNRLELLLENR